MHPTIGGLRIGKCINERKPAEPFNEQEEWDRDGQYYHYLTKWMHALNRVAQVTKNPIFNTWAIELAKTAHGSFVHSSPAGSKRMFWKMSIDLSYPLVSSMGQQDPLDGLVVYQELQSMATYFPDISISSLSSEVADMENLCEDGNWATQDPLGTGGNLSNACHIAQLIIRGFFNKPGLLNLLLESSLKGLSACVESSLFEFPAGYRLAFRELGLSIGLHAVEKLKETLAIKSEKIPGYNTTSMLIERFTPYLPLIDTIEKFWLDLSTGRGAEWKEHEDINKIMLATSLAPGSYLEL